MIYFVLDAASGLTKIGFTVSQATLAGRMSQYVTNCPGPVSLLRVIEGDREVERDMHGVLFPHHHRNEWFRVTDAQIDEAIRRPGLGTIFGGSVEIAVAVGMSPSAISRMAAEGRIPGAFRIVKVAPDGTESSRWFIPRAWADGNTYETISGRKRSLPAEVAPFIVEEYRKGRTLNSIATDIGYTRATVARSLIASGVAILARTGDGKKLPPGEQHPDAVLTAEQVHAIRKRCVAGELLHTIAADFGVSREAISRIKTGKNWKSLETPGLPSVIVTRRFDVALLPEAVDRYRSGLTMAEVARELGCHVCTIKRHFARTGVELRRRVESKALRAERDPRPQLTAEQVRTIRERVAAGESRNQVAISMGTSLGTVSQIAARKIWKHVA